MKIEESFRRGWQLAKVAIIGPLGVGFFLSCILSLRFSTNGLPKYSPVETATPLVFLVMRH